MRIALKIAYNGTRFHGYARQPKVNTVEGELLSFLKGNGCFADETKARIRTASRTDKGVSALGNVVAFYTELQKKQVVQICKKKLDDILVYGFAEVDDDFYPRHARQRIYRYHLSADENDIKQLPHVAALFTGEHNFRNFARLEQGKNPIRVIDSIVFSETNGFVVADFYAQNFLWNQIRRIVSAWKKYSQGKITLRQISDALHHPEQKVDFGVAPPEPLILMDVIYDVKFTYMNKSIQMLNNLENHIVSSFSVK